MHPLESVSTDSFVYLRSLIGHKVLVRLHSGEHYRGLLCYVDDDMNIRLRDSESVRGSEIEHIGDLRIQGTLIDNAQLMDTRADGDENTDTQRAINFDGNDEMSVVMEESGDPVDESVPSHNRVHSEQDSRLLLLNRSIHGNIFVDNQPGPSTSYPGPSTSSPGPSTSSPGPSTSSPGPSTSSPGPNTSSIGPSLPSLGPSPPSPVPRTPTPGSRTSFPVQRNPSLGSRTSFPGIYTPSLGRSSPFPGMCSSFPETSISLPCLSLSRPAPCINPRVLCTNSNVLCINPFGPIIPPTSPSSTASSSTTLQMDYSGSNTSLADSIIPRTETVDQSSPDIQLSINFGGRQGISLVMDDSQHTQSRARPSTRDDDNSYFYDERIWPRTPHPSPSSSQSGLTISELGSRTFQSGYGTYEAEPSILQSGPSPTQASPSSTQASPSSTQASSSSNEPRPATPKTGSSTSRTSSSTSRHSSRGFQSDD